MHISIFSVEHITYAICSIGLGHTLSLNLVAQSGRKGPFSLINSILSVYFNFDFKYSWHHCSNGVVSKAAVFSATKFCILRLRGVYRFSTTQRTSTTANESHAIAHASIRLKLAAAGAWLRSCDFAARITPKFQPPAHAAPTSKSVSTLGVCQQSVRVCMASTSYSLSNRQHRASDCCDLPSIGAYRSPVNTHQHPAYVNAVQAGV